MKEFQPTPLFVFILIFFVGFSQSTIMKKRRQMLFQQHPNPVIPFPILNSKRNLMDDRSYQINPLAYGSQYKAIPQNIINQYQKPVNMPSLTPPPPNFTASQMIHRARELKNNQVKQMQLQKQTMSSFGGATEMPHINTNSNASKFSASSTVTNMFAGQNQNKNNNPQQGDPRSNNQQARSLQTRMTTQNPLVNNPLQQQQPQNNKDFSMPSMSIGGKAIPGFNVKNQQIPKEARKLMMPGLGGDPPGPQPVLAPIQFPGIINPDIYISNTQAPPVIPQINPPPVKVDLKIDGMKEFYKQTHKPPVILNTLHHEIVNNGNNVINDIADQ